MTRCFFCKAGDRPTTLHCRADLTPIGTPAVWACEAHRRTPLKALTVWQPWASLIMIGAKPFEFRGWDFQKRERGLVGQRVVIHAGARPVKREEVEDLLRRLGGDDDMTGLVVDTARELLERVLASYKCQLLPLAAGLGTATLGRPRNAGLIFGANVADSDRGAFNFAWPLNDIEPFAAPVPAKGAQGFWIWRDRVALRDAA